MAEAAKDFVLPVTPVALTVLKLLALFDVELFALLIVPIYVLVVVVVTLVVVVGCWLNQSLLLELKKLTYSLSLYLLLSYHKGHTFLDILKRHKNISEK